MLLKAVVLGNIAETLAAGTKIRFQAIDHEAGEMKELPYARVFVSRYKTRGAYLTDQAAQELDPAERKGVLNRPVIVIELDLPK